MKKLTALTLTLAATLLFAGFAFAGNMDVNHGNMKHDAMKQGGAMAPEEALKSMDHNIKLMKEDVDNMDDESERAAAMDTMGKHMTDMHHAMGAMETHAKTSGNTEMQESMKKMNMNMMETMKGMGMMKNGKDKDKAMDKMNDGLDKMEDNVENMKDMM